VAEGEREVARLGEALAAARADLARRVGGLYRLGGQGQTYLRLLLSLEGGGDLLSGIRMLRYLARRDARSVERYTTARRELEDERELLLAKRRDVERWVAEEEARQGELASARRRQAALLARVEGERDRLAQRADELADRERKMSRFLDLLAGGGGDPAGTPIQQFRGVLDPPVAGEVSAGFGPRLDPRYRTKVPHNGLSLTTRAGDPVHAVYAGEVLYAAPFQGYGPTVVVHHPGRVFTLYAGLSELAVEVGQKVSLGETLGRAADELYFEVRVEKQPQDPEQWIR
jgi:septal ring factor EnvC (AmiA/AmiB activator)